MATAAEIAAYFEENGVDPTWNSGTAKLVDGVWTYSGAGATADADARMQSIADRINSGTLDWSSLDNSLAHILRSGGSTNSTGLTAGTGVIPGTTFVDPKLDRAQQRREMELIYGWLPSGAIDLWINEWIESGNEDAAWAVIRTNSQYEKWFPGNLTEDGRVRYSEEQYAATVESYRDIYRSMGLNSSLLDGRIGDLIRGEVSPNEFSSRVTGMWDRVISASESIRQYYADTNGVQGLTTEALLAGALDPDVGDKILDGRMSVAEVGGEALGSGFRLSAARVEELIGEGMTRNIANSLFGEAERLVPTLSVLARRHSDPNDEFDIEDFLSAEFFKNPAENLRTQRLVAQERAQFTSGLSARRNQAGAMTGLIAE
jgi:hypothetical protein